MTARMQLLCGFWPPAADSSQAEPALVKIELCFVSSSTYTATLPPNQLNERHLCAELPQLHLIDDRTDLVRNLVREYARRLTDDSLPRGILFETNGIHRLPNGELVYVWGNQLLGSCSAPYLIRSGTDFTLHIAPVKAALPRLLTELTFAAPQALLGLAYLFAALIRSWIIEITPSWQAGLNVVGPQGLGKTTLARRLTDWIQLPNRAPAVLFSAGSTPAAVRDAMVTARDLPLVVDDLCRSASPHVQRSYRDLGAQLVREGANAATITKKRPSGKVEHLHCRAGLILTAEFALENASDITRCVFVHIDKPLNLPASITSGLVGAACKEFLVWFLQHETAAREQLVSALAQPIAPQFHPRVFLNFTTLAAVLQFALQAAHSAGLSGETKQALLAQYNAAIADSLAYQRDLLRRLDAQRKKGNLSAILLGGLECSAFALAKKVDKLWKHDGVIWKRDLCLRRAALERFVRNQDGYQNYTISRIVQELKDIGALVIQEEGTAQVKLRKDLPRVYRIRLDVLRAHDNSATPPHLRIF